MNFDSIKILEDIEDFYCHLIEVYNIEMDKKYIKTKKRNKGIDEKDVLIELERLEKLKKDNINIIYDINYTFVNNIRINIILKKNRLVTQRKKYELEKNLENIKEDKKREIEIRIEDIKFEEEKLNEEYIKSKLNMSKIDDIYVTFKSTEDVEIIKKAYRLGICTRFWRIFCCNKQSIDHLQ